MPPFDVVWEVATSANPMGMEYAEGALTEALTVAAADGVRFHRRPLTAWAARVPGARRVPVRLQSGRVTGPVVGAGLFRNQHVHRFDLRLPPARDEVVTVHDLPPLRFDDEGQLPLHAGPSVRRARAVVCPSTFAATEVKELLGAPRVEVIPYGVDPLFRPGAPLPSGLLRRLGVDRPYVVHAAGATRRKNLDGLAAAWRALGRDDVQLLLCGPEDPRRTRAFAGVPGVVLGGRVPRPAVAALMARAAAVVVPSLYEGFGLPALEGMACGAPVVVADAGALPEVVQDAAVVAAPSGEGLADGLRRTLDDEALRRRLVADGPVRAAAFRWELAAQRHLDLYRGLWA